MLESKMIQYTVEGAEVYERKQATEKNKIEEIQGFIKNTKENLGI